MSTRSATCTCKRNQEAWNQFAWRTSTVVLLTLLGQSHWLLIDSNRNYPADVVGSRYNLFFFPRPVIVILYTAALFLSLSPSSRRSVSFLVRRSIFFKLSPRDPHATEGTSCQPAFITSNVHVCAYYTLYIPIERVKRKCGSVIKAGDRQNAKWIIF